MEDFGEPLFTNFSEADRQWRSRRIEEDKLQERFYKQLDVFPNLFSLKHLLHDTNFNKALLETQQLLIQDGHFTYHLEAARCQNVIIFLLYLLGRKEEAMNYCKTIQKTMKKSIIFLTLQAVLQWEFNQKNESSQTIKKLENTYKLLEYYYLVAVAEAEKGYLLLSLGPKGFLGAMDLLQKAIDACSGSDIYLWKFDLGLAIRRNFNIIVYSEHRKLSSSELATRAVEMLKDTALHCPNDAYKARGLVELGRLVRHLQIFADGFCRKEDKKTIECLCRSLDNDSVFFEKALAMECSKSDQYVLRECGRVFLYARQFERALSCLDDACKIKPDSMVYQLFGKVYRSMYSSRTEFISSAQETLLSNTHASLRDAHCDSLRSDLGSSSNIRSRQCCPGTGTCPVHHDSGEAKCLAAEFDDIPFMDATGQFRTTQVDGIGNILLARPASYRAGGQSVSGVEYNGRFPASQRPMARSFSNNDTPLSSRHRGNTIPVDKLDEARRLEADFDQNPFMDDSGEFLTTQPDGIEGVRFGHPPDRLNGHQASGPSRSKQRWNEDGRSATTSEDSGDGWTTAARRRPPTRSSHSFPPTNERRMKVVLKCKASLNYLDPSDRRIRAAELFLLKALEENPRNMAVVFDIGFLYEHQRKQDEALKFYQKIIIHKDSSSPIQLVNAYERSGLCLMKMCENMTNFQQQERLKKQAEDMFMSSLMECRRAVAHMPEVSANRGKLWGSYPSLLSLLRSQSAEGKGGATKLLSKEAKAHEAVGDYLKAIDVYNEVLKLAETRRTDTLRRSVENYLRLDKVTDAKFILDCFLLPASEDRDFILNAEDDDTRRLRDVAVQVYTRAARQALTSGDARDRQVARASFQTALLLKSRLLNHGPDEAVEGDRRVNGAEVEMMEEQFDVCVFHEDDSPDEELEQLSSAMALIMREIFGLRVSVNTDGTMPGHLCFDSELRMAESAALVLLVITPGSRLSPRMTFIADTVLRSHTQDRVLPVLAGRGDISGSSSGSFFADQSGSYHQHSLPPPLHYFEPYCGAEKCLAVDVHGVRNHVSTVVHLFQFLLEGRLDKEV